MEPPSNPFLSHLSAYLNASYPMLWVSTHEESRVVTAIVTAFLGADCEAKGFQKRRVFDWDAISGLSEHKSVSTRTEPLSDSASIKKLLDKIAALIAQQSSQLFILRDFHPYINEPAVKRYLRNLSGKLKASGCTILFLSPSYAVPEELTTTVQTLDFALPDTAGIRASLEFVRRNALKSVAKEHHAGLELPEDIALKAIEAARGMTDPEVENAFTLALVRARAFSPAFVQTVFDEKVQHVKSNSLLTYLAPDLGFDQIGGLSGLKTWIRQRGQAYSPEARLYGLPFPRGMLLCGVPGCGS